MYRFGTGFVLTAFILIVWSFLLVPGWPLEYWQAIQGTEPIVHATSMPNLRSLLYGLPGDTAIQVFGVIVGMVFCWRVARTSCANEEAIAFCFLAGLVCSSHAYAYDCVVALPAVAVVIARAGLRPHWKALAAALLSLSPVLLIMDGWRFIPQLIFVGLLPVFQQLCASRIPQHESQ